MRKKLRCVIKNFKLCERKFLFECCARKSYQSPLSKTEDQRLKDIRAYAT